MPITPQPQDKELAYADLIYAIDHQAEWSSRWRRRVPILHVMGGPHADPPPPDAFSPGFGVGIPRAVNSAAIHCADMPVLLRCCGFSSLARRGAGGRPAARQFDKMVPSLLAARMIGLDVPPTLLRKAGVLVIGQPGPDSRHFDQSASGLVGAATYGSDITDAYRQLGVYASRLVPMRRRISTDDSASGAVGARRLAFAAQWLAYALPYRRFVGSLTGANARLGADVDRYSFIVVDFAHAPHAIALVRMGQPACCRG